MPELGCRPPMVRRSAIRRQKLQLWRGKDGANEIVGRSKRITLRNLREGQKNAPHYSKKRSKSSHFLPLLRLLPCHFCLHHSTGPGEGWGGADKVGVNRLQRAGERHRGLWRRRATSITARPGALALTLPLPVIIQRKKIFSWRWIRDAWPPIASSSWVDLGYCAALFDGIWSKVSSLPPSSCVSTRSGFLRPGRLRLQTSKAATKGTIAL
ncbi:hypothetical protein B0H16DRAFT_1464375 [Mycena metata]|uniref:Uncharacterized protein n=1 Tax=Mycena metata TaxID=1033252 RepID=A0AAD7N0X1_9AGAR|nr:hypothetical protein B0H16DRAFT_1464375 [Mycena metata]